VLRGGATPLLFAARVGDVESARLLLKAGADANESQPDGVSALVLAAHSGNGPVGAVLLEHGADPNAFGSGYTALHAAILRSDVNLVKALLARGANPNLRIAKGTPMRRDTTDWNLPATLIGSTPYLLAARFLEPAIMSALVAGGADPAATLPNGADAVMLAAGMGSSRTASRRGIETIDFRQSRTGEQECARPSKPRSPCAATARPRARSATPRCTSPRLSATTPSCSSSSSTARASARRTGAASRR
jgi:hypothetical protein